MRIRACGGTLADVLDEELIKVIKRSYRTEHFVVMVSREVTGSMLNALTEQQHPRAPLAANALSPESVAACSLVALLSRQADWNDSNLIVAAPPPSTADNGGEQNARVPSVNEHRFLNSVFLYFSFSFFFFF